VGAPPMILFRLGPWTDDDDRDLPRPGYGYRDGMGENELCDSTRAWWYLSHPRAQRYSYAAAVAGGVIRGVWEIDQGPWRWIDGARLGKAARRWAFATRPAPRELVAWLVGNPVPTLRPDGRHTFGSGGVVAYWPE
jgi:hypothetical protein